MNIEGYAIELMYEGLSQDEITWELCRLQDLQEEEEPKRA